MKRIFWSVVISLLFGLLPCAAHWLSGNDFIRSSQLAATFVMSVLMFLVALLLSYTCPLWSHDNDN